MHFESKKDRKIRELQEENERLQKEYLEQLNRNNELSETVNQLTQELESERKKTRRDVFIAEKGLLPCESPACQMCKRAVLYDGKIAGCSKGIACTDFEQKPDEKPSTQIVPIPFPAQPYYGTCFHFPF